MLWEGGRRPEDLASSKSIDWEGFTAWVWYIEGLKNVIPLSILGEAMVRTGDNEAARLCEEGGKRVFWVPFKNWALKVFFRRKQLAAQGSR